MRIATLFGFLVALAALFVLALPATPSTGNAQPDAFSRFIRARGDFVSQAVLARYYSVHPEAAPPQLREGFEALRSVRANLAEATVTRADVEPASPGVVFKQKRFNLETTGLPQNEISVAFCKKNQILEGSNDYRGLVSASGDFTGFHYSKNFGWTVLRDGQVAGVTANDSTGTPTFMPSGGDPWAKAASIGGKCTFYMAGLAMDFDGDPNGIMVARATAAQLESASCTSGSTCWPTRTAAATAVIGASCPGPFFFLDKPSMDVGQSGAATYVWIAYTEFDLCGAGPSGPWFDKIKAVRCNAALSSCTAPITLATVAWPNYEVQFTDVQIAPDGRVYVSWIKDDMICCSGERFEIKMRVFPAGSTTPGPTRTVAWETKPIGFSNRLSYNDFRIATIPMTAVLDMGGGTNRFYVAWARCKHATPFGAPCKDADIKIRYTDNDGVSFGPIKGVGRPKSQYWPDIAADNVDNMVYLQYYTNEADNWNHRQKVVLERRNPGLTPLELRTTNINEPDADPWLGGFFIGDYNTVVANDGLVLVGYNANYTSLPPNSSVFGSGLPPMFQQDNYLFKFIYP